MKSPLVTPNINIFILWRVIENKSQFSTIFFSVCTLNACALIFFLNIEVFANESIYSTKYIIFHSMSILLFLCYLYILRPSFVLSMIYFISSTNKCIKNILKTIKNYYNFNKYCIVYNLAFSQNGIKRYIIRKGYGFRIFWKMRYHNSYVIMKWNISVR